MISEFDMLDSPWTVWAAVLGFLIFAWLCL